MKPFEHARNSAKRWGGDDCQVTATREGFEIDSVEHD